MSTTPVQDAGTASDLPSVPARARKGGAPDQAAPWRYIFGGLLLAAIWIGLYESLAAVSKGRTYSLLRLAPGARWKSPYVSHLETGARLS